MRLEGFQFLVALLAPLLAAALFVRIRSRGVARGLAIGILALGFVMALVFEGLRDVPADEAEVVNRPIRVDDNGYVSSTTCRSCHPHEWSTWHDSYHRQMTQVASPEAVIGKFDGQTRSVLDQRFRLLREGDRFFVDFEESESEPAGRREIVMTTGAHHMQAYWYETDEDSGREISQLPLVYLRKEQKWIPERASFLKPSWEQMGPTTLPSTQAHWNEACQQCHATAPQPRIDEKDTKVAELGIACEACHGPASEHVAHYRDPATRYRRHLGKNVENESDEIVDPADLDPQRASEVCGQCHGIWQAIDNEESERSLRGGFAFQPGEALEISKFTVHQGNMMEPRVRALLHGPGGNPNFLVERYWRDGLIRVAGREFVGLVDSPCFKDATSNERKLSCLTCHVMHKPAGDERAIEDWTDDQLKAGYRTNEACLPCHEEYRDEQALTAHTHHGGTSSGSLCYNCHMPYNTYGLMKAIRSHTIVTPSVAESSKVGRPNACNLCHLDQTLAWSADHLETWWGQPKPELSDEQKDIAASVLWMLKGDAGQRALTVWAYGWEDARRASGTGWMMPFVAPLLLDPYDVIRFMSHRTLKTLPGAERVAYDFVGPAAQREAAVSTAMGIWRARGDRGKPRSTLLRGDDGSFDRSLWEKLIGERDDRVVSLEE